MDHPACRALRPRPRGDGRAHRRDVTDPTLLGHEASAVAQRAADVAERPVRPPQLMHCGVGEAVVERVLAEPAVRIELGDAEPEGPRLGGEGRIGLEPRCVGPGAGQAPGQDAVAAAEDPLALPEAPAHPHPTPG